MSLRTCQTCDKPLIKRSHESLARYAAKKFCSSTCSRVFMKKNKLGWWSPEIVRSIKQGRDSGDDRRLTC